MRALRSELTFCSKVRHGYIERSRKKPSARAFCCAEVTCPPCFLGFLAIVDVRASPKLLENQGAARAGSGGRSCERLKINVLPPLRLLARSASVARARMFPLRLPNKELCKSHITMTRADGWMPVSSRQKLSWADPRER